MSILFAGLRAALDTLDSERLEAWGQELARRLGGGARVLCAGNGGSAAEAQHLTAELVGRFEDTERPPLSALALHAETSSFTALANDFGYADVFARGVRAHGRPGDVLLCLSTSGRSENLLAAVAAARAGGLLVWALTGAAPNPLHDVCDEAVAVASVDAATVQEVHLVAVHALCRAVDAAHARPPGGVRDETPPLVVVGDLLLDRDWEGTVERVAPDAPVPVVRDPVAADRPGGAGLAALLAAGAGQRVVLVCGVGRGEAGRRARGLLAAAGVEVVDLGLAGPTPEKIRVKAGGQVLVRLDRGDEAAALGDCPPAASDALARARAVLVADYGRGVAAQPALRAALSALPAEVPIVWDPHPAGPEPVPGVLVVCPNRSEARGLVGDEPGEGPAATTRRARRLLERWGAVNVCVTLGAEGALLVSADGGPPLALPVARAERGDPCGAGDAFAAALAVALAEGALPSEAARRAVVAAAAWVAHGGREREPGPATTAAGDAREVIARVRRAGGTVVATGGCFDLLHAGHVAVLEQARRLGGCLVVCLNSDASVARLKGPERPLVGEEDRAEVLRCLGCVDAVVVFAEDTPEEILAELRPDLWVKGGDYRVQDLPEAGLLESWGGQAVVLPFVPGRSTSEIIAEARARA